MGLFSIILIVVVVLAIIGLGWKIFSSGVLSGFEKVINLGYSLKKLTDQARKYVNNPATKITN